MPEYELLAPAGSMECLDAALRFGADAVYVGGPKLQLRAGQTGFSMDALKEAARKAHAAGKRLYVAANAFASNADIDAAGDYARALQNLGTDAAILSDLGMIAEFRRAAPDLDVHVSTQANCLNYAAARAYADLGCRRVVLGREMTLQEIAALRRRVPAEMELEAFAHGAMCMAYSGRCLISAYLTGRSANRGACTQPCRWKYHLMEETRPGEYFPIEEDDDGSAILSFFDLNCLDLLDQMMEAGVTSFKLEGRMKSPFYVAAVTNAYRRRIDGILRGEAEPETLAALQRELRAVSHRAYSSGFYLGGMKRHAPDSGAYLQETTFVGAVRGVRDGRIAVALRNRFSEGDVLELLSPRALGLRFVARDIVDASGENVTAATHPDEIYTLACDCPAEAGDFLRLRIAE